MIFSLAFSFYDDVFWKSPVNFWNKGKSADDYVIIGWNDLGMHCINPSYKEMALYLPSITFGYR